MVKDDLWHFTKVTQIGDYLLYQNKVFSETIRSIELDFPDEDFLRLVSQIYTNCFGLMTMMADMPIYGKTL